jgi:hypothetical protein
MSEYDPPIEDLPIFNNSLFTDLNSALTIKNADKRYLRYPLAQGNETLQNVEVTGNLTMLSSAGYASLHKIRYTGFQFFTNSATLTIAMSGHTIFMNGAITVTLTLPVPVLGVSFNIVNMTQQGRNVYLNINRNGSTEIFYPYGLTTLRLNYNETVGLVSDGSNWYQVYGNYNANIINTGLQGQLFIGLNTVSNYWQINGSNDQNIQRYVGSGKNSITIGNGFMNLNNTTSTQVATIALNGPNGTIQFNNLSGVETSLIDSITGHFSPSSISLSRSNIYINANYSPTYQDSGKIIYVYGGSNVLISLPAAGSTYAAGCVFSIVNLTTEIVLIDDTTLINKSLYPNYSTAYRLSSVPSMITLWSPIYTVPRYNYESYTIFTTTGDIAESSINGLILTNGVCTLYLPALSERYNNITFSFTCLFQTTISCSIYSSDNFNGTGFPSPPSILVIGANKTIHIRGNPSSDTWLIIGGDFNSLSLSMADSQIVTIPSLKTLTFNGVGNIINANLTNIQSVDSLLTNVYYPHKSSSTPINTSITLTYPLYNFYSITTSSGIDITLPLISSSIIGQTIKFRRFTANTVQVNIRCPGPNVIFSFGINPTSAIGQILFMTSGVYSYAEIYAFDLNQWILTNRS